MYLYIRIYIDKWPCFAVISHPALLGGENSAAKPRLCNSKK